MTDLTFAMLDGRRKERKGKKQNKQTEKQNLAGYYFLEEARCFSRPISYVVNEHHGLVLKCQI